MDSELFKEWFGAFAGAAGITLHVETLYGVNNHHIVESCFKGLARSLRTAVTLDPRKLDAIPSTKGTLGGAAAAEPASRMAETVAVIDYGAGNLRSVANALAAAGARVEVTGEPRTRWPPPTASCCRASARSGSASARCAGSTGWRTR